MLSITFHHDASLVFLEYVVSILFYMTDPFEWKSFKARGKIGEYPGIVGHDCSYFIAECFPPEFVVWPSHSISKGLWFTVLFEIRAISY